MTIKLFFLDMDNTLFREDSARADPEHGDSLWLRIPHALGPGAIEEDRALVRKWEEGGFRNYGDWCEASLHVHQKYGLTKTRFRQLIEEMPYGNGAHELLEGLHARGIVPAIISGGFFEQAGKAQKELRIPHALASVKHLWNDDGTIGYWNILPSDLHAKVDFVELLRNEYNVEVAECAFCGDGKNDVAIAKHVGLSFAFKGHAELQKAATHSVTDLRDILKHL